MLQDAHKKAVSDDAGLKHLSVCIEELSNTWICLQCFMDCFYKKSKYIPKGGTLNMKMVKLDAEHLYEKRPKEKEYYIKAYDECNKRSRNILYSSCFYYNFTHLYS